MWEVSTANEGAGRGLSSSRLVRAVLFDRDSYPARSVDVDRR